ncbi:MAG: alpha/beta hydrolase [Gammaproteobacteria bacterium]|nr:alpha/beta hydrolase [Gammaproteobacteria bacterium]
MAYTDNPELIDLISVFPLRSSSEIKVGHNTAALFANTPSPTADIPSIDALRESIAAWDRDYALPYPDGFYSASFIDDSITGVPSSIYRLPDGDACTPTVLLIHGGAFFCELTNVFKSLMANIIVRAPCHAVLPHYSLSPEFKAPQAITDVKNVLLSLLKEPEKYGLTRNIIIVGYSSGGNVAWNAVLNILNEPATKALISRISNVVLMSPWADISMETTKCSPFKAQQDKDEFLQIPALERAKDFYLSPGMTGKEPFISPVYRPVEEIKGMPPTTVIVGEIDRLFADSILTAKVLKEAGVPVQIAMLEGQSHNHSAHKDLVKDGVFTPDIIANIMKGLPIQSLKGSDGLGLWLYQPDAV